MQHQQLFGWEHFLGEVFSSARPYELQAWAYGVSAQRFTQVFRRLPGIRRQHTLNPLKIIARWQVLRKPTLRRQLINQIVAIGYADHLTGTARDLYPLMQRHLMVSISEKDLQLLLIDAMKEGRVYIDPETTELARAGFPTVYKFA